MVKKIRVCNGPMCSAKGSAEILEKLSRITGVAAGEANSEYDLGYCGCLGHCHNSPNVLVDEEIIESVKLDNVESDILLEGGKKAKKIEDYNADELIKDDFLNDI